MSVVMITLTKGHVAVVDSVDYERVLAAGPWHAQVSPAGKVYAKHSITSRTSIFMHNVVTGLDFVDHINGNGVDNRRSNLRAASLVENACNRGKQANNTSGFKGVTWNKHRRKWVAQIEFGGVKFYLGGFADPVEAAKVYDDACREMHGEFARTNFERNAA